ncbi:MAG: twin-arginine translocase TatA/TatE family subunit [Bacteroidales bacterium]|nr:twin-arginine translocase TatA/TatE family subunit [Bacteroidales bacterium]MBR6331070.1 twin-arginine translocase TatA/TatE family subunit [Bacteroidales bacterium]
MILLNLGAPEIILIVLAVLILFGGKKIPELMRGLGKGVKEYKNAVNSVEDEVKSATDTGEEKKDDKA